ncbi:hypothetical protein [Williamsia muralis]|uniref:hypothetical protein n=1 Tax=Williamsia marianensis TaxID=85044 RepID=UPI00166F713E|nr:hypothetical protein [Williamsia marianensis]
MNDPNSVIPQQAIPGWWRGYESAQARRHQKFMARSGTRFNGLRNRRSARRLIIALIATMLLIFATAIAMFFTDWAAVPFVGLVFCALLPLVYALKVVTLNVSDAPAAVLDEIQLASRNAARSIAYTALWISMFIPYAILLILSTGRGDSVDAQAIYGSAVLLIILVTAATCIPTCLIGWWLPDPDPEDFATYPQVVANENVSQSGGFEQ